MRKRLPAHHYRCTVMSNSLASPSDSPGAINWERCRICIKVSVRRIFACCTASRAASTGRIDAWKFHLTRGGFPSDRRDFERYTLQGTFLSMYLKNYHFIYTPNLSSIFSSILVPKPLAIETGASILNCHRPCQFPSCTSPADPCGSASAPT